MLCLVFFPVSPIVWFHPPNLERYPDPLEIDSPRIPPRHGAHRFGPFSSTESFSITQHDIIFFWVYSGARLYGQRM